MSEIKIRTNNHPRHVIEGYELSVKEREEFNYINWEKVEAGEDSATFFRYRGQLYDIGEFSRIIPQGFRRYYPTECDNPAFSGWDGYMSDSFFSGLLIRYTDSEYDSVVVGLYTS